VNGNAYPGTLREGPADYEYGMAMPSPPSCLAAPFESAKLGSTVFSVPARICV